MTCKYLTDRSRHFSLQSQRLKTLKWLSLLTIKKNLNKSTVMGCVQAKLLFKLLHSVNICIRGSRARNVNKTKKITLMIKKISNVFMTSASTKNKSSIVRKDFDILQNILFHN